MSLGCLCAGSGPSGRARRCATDTTYIYGIVSTRAVHTATRFAHVRQAGTGCCSTAQHSTAPHSSAQHCPSLWINLARRPTSERHSCDHRRIALLAGCRRDCRGNHDAIHWDGLRHGQRSRGHRGNVRPAARARCVTGLRLLFHCSSAAAASVRRTHRSAISKRTLAYAGTSPTQTCP